MCERVKLLYLTKTKQNSESCKEPSMKDVRTKSRKIDPSWLQNVLTGSTPLVRANTA